MQLEEQWVAIDGLERYAISNYGRIVNQETDRELIPTPDKNGYLRVTLSRNGEKFNVYLHRMVAFAFFLNYEPGVAVEHRDGNKSDCSVLNLTLGGPCRVGDTHAY